ncbi:MAG TPA: N-acetyltransferase [Roseburia sp.]|nr:N-acetyltransferase [Roseburia sp.]
MLKLRFILADRLPEWELVYLKQNIRPESDLKLVVTGKTNLDRMAEFSLFPPEESVLISTDGHIISTMDQAGMATLGYIGTTESRLPDENTDQGMQAAIMLIEGLEEADRMFLERVYERKHGIPWTIVTTERCIVREITLDDMDGLFALYAGEGMTEYLDPLYEYEKEKEYQKSYINYMYRLYGYGMWVVIEKKTGKLIGRVGIENREACDGEPELGYMIDVSHQKKGYATEVCLAVIGYAWDFLEFDKLNCLIQKGNTASECLAEKLGFTFQEEMDLDGKCMKRYTISKSGA